MLDIEKKFVAIVAEEMGVGIADINRDTPFADLGLDSLDFVEICLEAEDQFDIDIQDEKAEQFKTVGEAVLYLEERINGKSGTLQL